MAVELEHLIGYSGQHRSCLLWHPAEPTIIYSCGSAVVMQNVEDPHKQEFFRAHDSDITALALSQDGKTLLSGQAASPRRKDGPSEVIAWDLQTRKGIGQFAEMRGGIIAADMSADGRFAAASSEERQLFVWDVQTGEVVVNKRSEQLCSTVKFSSVERAKASRYPEYMLVTTLENQVVITRLTFDLAAMNYRGDSQRAQLPSSGLQRRFLCALTSPPFFLAGTTAGDLLIFNMDTSVFRAAIPVTANGVQAMCGQDGRVVLGGGDGSVKICEGRDAQWEEVKAMGVSGCVSGLALSPDGQEVVCGTTNGRLFRVMLSDMTATVLGHSHCAALTSLVFGTTQQIFASTSRSGEAHVWDLSDYRAVVQTQHPAKKAALAVCLAFDDTELLVGYEDGAIRGYFIEPCLPKQQPEDKNGSLDTPTDTTSSSPSPSWEIPTSHRGAVTALTAAQGQGGKGTMLVSGGEDGYVRVWHPRTREMVGNYSVAKRAVTGLKVDHNKPHVVHACSADKLLVSLDLQKDKKVCQHAVVDGVFTGLAQRKDHEYELITSGVDGRLLFWDEDEADPVAILTPMPDPVKFPNIAGAPTCLSGITSAPKLLCVSVSPSGRYVACGAHDNLLYIYDLQGRELMYTGFGHTGRVVAVAWSPDEKQILTAAEDCSVAVWNCFE
ncbi:unnamed protein product [Vitrella brassicaformis CCMP3155]|uniref:Anaphase-promoting complex subunit 4 WD40 domain-containing protein n=1 Tax=Vitrella brassicaformis (strain CCMP3155) TaxID=1169540 RepID=A0A0G4F1G4_VITBC|nr:unnamed protein product [Vitrella brassicaformis CCMP3155]|eukprot:CEM05742.1 unnamed protein product [Vitrella brassicaformis CCMP3155]